MRVGDTSMGTPPDFLALRVRRLPRRVTPVVDSSQARIIRRERRETPAAPVPVCAVYAVSGRGPAPPPGVDKAPSAGTHGTQRRREGGGLARAAVRNGPSRCGTAGHCILTSADGRQGFSGAREQWSSGTSPPFD